MTILVNGDQRVGWSFCAKAEQRLSHHSNTDFHLHKSQFKRETLTSKFLVTGRGGPYGRPERWKRCYLMRSSLRPLIAAVEENENVQELLLRSLHTSEAAFNLNIYSEQQCLIACRFKHVNIGYIARLIDFGERATRTGHHCEQITATCILLQRLATSVCWSDVKTNSCMFASQMSKNILRVYRTLYRYVCTLFEAQRGLSRWSGRNICKRYWESWRSFTAVRRFYWLHEDKKWTTWWARKSTTFLLLWTQTKALSHLLDVINSRWPDTCSFWARRGKKAWPDLV